MPEMTAPMLGAVELACQRYAEMVAWYRNLLTADIEYRDAVQTWLICPGGWHLVLTARALDPGPREAAGVVGPALQFADFPALRAAYHALCAHNLYPVRGFRNGMVTSLEYRDPDGNPVALRVVLGRGGEAQEQLDPIGEEFDPKEMMETETA